MSIRLEMAAAKDGDQWDTYTYLEWLIEAVICCSNTHDCRHYELMQGWKGGHG